MYQSLSYGHTHTLDKSQGGDMGDGGGGEATPLGIKSMAGTFVISMALMLIGLVVHFVQVIRLRRHPGSFPPTNFNTLDHLLPRDCPL